MKFLKRRYFFAMLFFNKLSSVLIQNFEQKFMSINAFVDHGFPPGEEFCVKFLSSNEFTIETLQLISSGTGRLKKKLN
jgi:hypothetical protein